MSPSEPESALRYWDASASKIETVADELIALVEEFEASINAGQVPPAFADRLAQLRQNAEGLIKP